MQLAEDQLSVKDEENAAQSGNRSLEAAVSTLALQALELPRNKVTTSRAWLFQFK